MIRLLARKLLPYRSFTKFTVLHVGAMLLLVFVATHLSSFSTNGGSLPLGAMFARPDAWQSVCALTRWLFFIPAFFVIQMVCAELEMKLVRAQILAGLERRQIIAGWLLQNVVVTVVATTAAVAATLLICSSNGTEATTSPLVTELGFFLYGMLFLAFALLWAIVTRRPIPATVLLLCWPIAIEPLLGVALDHYVSDGLSSYLPFACFSSLVTWPTGGGAVLSLTAPSSLLSLGYGVIAILLGWLRLARLDL